MNDENNHSFYYNAVSAKAAWIERDNKIIARCIIFDSVHDANTGEILRLAERQYSDTDRGKEILIGKLIAAEEIDGYKRFGACCSDSTAFVSAEGDDWSKREFFIDCELNGGDTVSYQDSFKYYDMDERRAYNYYPGCNYHDLAITSGELEAEWDEYNGEYCSETVTVYFHGREISCNVEKLEDFYEINGDYYHYDDTEVCERCGDRFVSGEGYYSDLTECEYCCEDCREIAENEYKEDNWEEDILDPGEYVDPDSSSTVEIIFEGVSGYTDECNLPDGYKWSSESIAYISPEEWEAVQFQQHLNFA
jgi:hypothetical protein